MYTIGKKLIPTWKKIMPDCFSNFLDNRLNFCYSCQISFKIAFLNVEVVLKSCQVFQQIFKITIKADVPRKNYQSICWEDVSMVPQPTQFICTCRWISGGETWTVCMILNWIYNQFYNFGKNSNVLPWYLQSSQVSKEEMGHQNKWENHNTTKLYKKLLIVLSSLSCKFTILRA